MNPLLRHPHTTLLLPPAYLGHVARYALMGAYGRVIVHNGMRADKRRKEVHRADIVDTRGPLQLTIPLQGPVPRRWADALISGHGRWQQVHATTLASAYGRTPFYEFYADRLNALILNAQEGDSLTGFTSAMDSLICRLLGIPEPGFLTELPELDPASTVDLRRTPLPEAEIPYYQVRADRLGFHPGLSIIDALCNLGNETPILLLKTNSRCYENILRQPQSL